MEHVGCLYLVAILTAAVSLLYYYLTRNYGYWKSKSIPCLAGALPGLGNVYPMIFMRKNMSDMYLEFYNRMPSCSMFGFYNLRAPSLMVREPELVKTVLAGSFQNFSDNSFRLDPELDPLLSANPFFIGSDRWKLSRQQMTVAFTSGKLKYMFGSVSEACGKLNGHLDRLLGRAESGRVELELKDLFSRFTAELVASAAFGVDDGTLRGEKDGPFREMGKLLLEPSLAKGISQMVVLFVPLLGRVFRFRFTPARVDRFFRSVVQRVLHDRESRGTQRADFLQLMIERKRAGRFDPALNQAFDDDAIAAHAASFFFDGYETSSISLSFLAYQLAKHPGVQDRVREEVRDAVARHGGLTYAAIQEMGYTDRVIAESMRLFPAFGTFIKVCTGATELVGSDGIRCRVAPGTEVVIPAAALHRDPAYWPEPEKFDPERFSDETAAARHKFVHLPFGGGPRICIGMRMAMLQIKAAIATVVQGFRLHLSPRTREPIQLDSNYFMASAKGGLWVNVESLEALKSDH